MDNENIATYLRNHKPVVSGYVDGNAYAVLGVTKRNIEKTLRNKFDARAIETFKKSVMDEATSGDYHHLLRTCMEYVEFDV